MKKLRTLEGVPLTGKRVLLRVDFNAAVDDDGRVLPGADHRLRTTLPTIETLQRSGARVIMLSHLGRPGGTVVPHLRLKGIIERCAQLVGLPIRALPDVVSPAVEEAVRAMKDGDMVALENLRFHHGEEANDQGFARSLAAYGDLLVHDAFGVAHRAHASVATLPRLVPAFAGQQLALEVRVLGGILDHPARPAVAIVGGAKLETKLGLIKNLLPRVDALLTGGGVANSCLQAAGRNVGSSLADRGSGTALADLLQEYGDALHLPTDVRVLRAGHGQTPLVLPVAAVTAADTIGDIGPETVVRYCRVLRGARTCVWNGPLGKFELQGFGDGTTAVAQCIRGAETFAVVGGGDSVRALEEGNLLGAFDHVSTGGGAMLAFLEGAPMPGLEALYEKA